MGFDGKIADPSRPARHRQRGLRALRRTTWRWRGEQVAAFEAARGARRGRGGGGRPDRREPARRRPRGGCWRGPRRSPTLEGARMTLLVLGLVIWTAAHLFKRVAPERARRASPPRSARGRRRAWWRAVIAARRSSSIVVGFRQAPFVAGLRPAVLGHPPQQPADARRRRAPRRRPLEGPGARLAAPPDADRRPRLGGRAPAGERRPWPRSCSSAGWGSGRWPRCADQRPRAGLGAPGAGRQLAGDVRLVVITLVVFAVIATVHTWLGYWPFPQ